MTRPQLSPEQLESESRLYSLIDELLVRDRRYWRHTRQILRGQLRHQELASEDAFIAYLELEELLNARSAWMLIAVARWAFQEGRRHRDEAER